LSIDESQPSARQNLEKVVSNTVKQLPLPGMLSLVMPAHNEAPNMAELMTVAARVLPQLAERSEIVLVDDGSTDGTAKAAMDALPDSFKDCLHVITHAQKSGYGISVGDGLRATKGDWIAFCDSDLQFDLSDFLGLAVHLGEADLVTGYRRKRADHWKRSVTSHTYNFVVQILYQVRFKDIDCAMKIMSRSFLDAISPIVSRSATINVEMYFKARRLKRRVLQFPVGHYHRTAGERSGGKLRPIIRAIKELTVLRSRINASQAPAGRP
jgi:glycosyltransferase involved in cell wall biosynthesis